MSSRVYPFLHKKNCQTEAPKNCFWSLKSLPVLEPENPRIDEFYKVQGRRATNINAPIFWERARRLELFVMFLCSIL